MSSKSGLKFLKALLFVINLLLVITGTALLCAGIWLCSNSTISQFTGDSSLKSIQSIIYTASYILIAYGGSTFLVAMCGCCNIFHTNQRVTGLYVALVTLLILSEITGAVIVYIKRRELSDLFKNSSFDFIHDKYTEDELSQNLAWNNIMYQFRCCGVNSYMDFDESSVFRNSSSDSVPQVCCKQKNRQVDMTRRLLPVDIKLCQVAATTRVDDPSPTFLNSKGCYRRLMEWLSAHATVFISAAGGVAGIELIVIITALIYYHKIKHDYW